MVDKSWGGPFADAVFARPSDRDVELINIAKRFKYRVGLAPSFPAGFRIGMPTFQKNAEHECNAEPSTFPVLLSLPPASASPQSRQAASLSEASYPVKRLDRPLSPVLV